jgi:hypothetical protein
VVFRRDVALGVAVLQCVVPEHYAEVRVLFALSSLSLFIPIIA